MQEWHFCHNWLVVCGFLACDTFYIDKKSYIGIADCYWIIFLASNVGYSSLELGGNKKTQQDEKDVGKLKKNEL